MDYEKKYKEAIEIAREYKSKGYFLINCALQSIFPELKESEDEKIRKDLINFVEQYGDNYYGQVAKAYAITWLEKQGEQKPAWNGADEAGFGDALWAVEQARSIAKDENDMGNLWYAERWLKSIKERMKGE